MQSDISKIQAKNTFFGVNINKIEGISFFDKDGLAQSYFGDTIKNEIVKFSQNHFFAIVNIKGGGHVMVLPDK